MIHISNSYEQKIFAPSTFYASAQENVRKVKESWKKFGESLYNLWITIMMDTGY